MLGEAIDPFSAAQGGSRAKGEDSAASKDKEYQSLLDSGDEVMGTIKIPKISVNLPIYHGTSQTALASGAWIYPWCEGLSGGPRPWRLTGWE